MNIKEMAVCVSAFFKDKGGEAHTKGDAAHADKTASLMTLVGADFVERTSKCMDME